MIVVGNHHCTIYTCQVKQTSGRLSSCVFHDLVGGVSLPIYFLFTGTHIAVSYHSPVLFPSKSTIFSEVERHIRVYTFDIVF